MESINISFSANRQTLTGGGLYCASNTVHYIIADFELGDGWDGFDSVRAVWSNDFKCISTVLDPGGSCTVPHEVLERRGKVSVNLVGSILEGDELTDRLTTYPILAITVDANAKICGTETAEVTPSQFEQFVQIVKDEVAKVKDIDKAELNEDYTLTFYFSDGTETTVGPIRGEQGETGNGIASAVLNDDYTLTLTFTDGTEYTTPSIRGEQGEQGEPGEVTLAQLSSVLPTDTASGAIASFPDGSDLFDYLSCIVNIEPVQAGSGTPSPDNVRPITGWTGCNVVVSPTQDAQDGTTYPVSWQTEAGTVYGGTVDLVTGVLTVDRAVGNLEDLDWSDSSATRYISNVISGMKPVPDGDTLPKLIAEKYRTIKWSDGLSINHDGIAVANSNYAYFYLYRDENTQTPSGKFVYELATPQTYQLDPVKVACLLGQNNVWAFCGSIEEVKYKADVQKWVEKKLGE